MKLTRRRFLQSSSAVVSGMSLPMYLTLPKQAYAASDQDYKALVCVFLPGGCDSFNMVLPRSGQHYLDYREARPKMSHTNDVMLDTGLVSENGVELGLNPNMPLVAELMRNGQATTLLNIGTLLEPTTKDNWDSVRKPSNLGSHNTQQNAWIRRYDPEKKIFPNIGWGGALMDEIHNPAVLLPESLKVSNSGWLGGLESEAFRISSSSALKRHVQSKAPELEAITKAYFKAATLSPMQQELIRRHKSSYETLNTIDNVLKQYPPDTSITGGDLSNQLRLVKQMIEAAPALGHQRTIFVVTMGGWDTHGKSNNGALGTLDKALGTFQAALTGAGLSEQVVTFTMSDFGRTINSNSNNGTDHGWGSNQLVLGGSIVGHKAYGRFPEFRRGGTNANGNSFIPELSHEQMGATFGEWLGLNEVSMNTVFPMLNPNASNPFSKRTLGFLSGEQGSSEAIYPFAVSASDENPNGIDKVKHAVDGNSSTKWSAKGLGVSYTLMLPGEHKLSNIKLAQAKGNERKYKFLIQISNDGNNYKTVKNIVTSGNTEELESYSLSMEEAKFIRLICNGNDDPNRPDLRKWNNFSQIEVWGKVS
ncbi:DUF1501 domain-containing protein [Vibrio maritimus]|uniref:DUF1501 domain-containing protein n=1 Tax=Vibrio maritimus TaxID=990268 RepID=UPI001F458250|nr:DUF1501 domain-containing protein [Vibrio maritimus]